MDELFEVYHLWYMLDVQTMDLSLYAELYKFFSTSNMVAIAYFLNSTTFSFLDDLSRKDYLPLVWK